MTVQRRLRRFLAATLVASAVLSTTACRETIPLTTVPQKEDLMTSKAQMEKRIRMLYAATLEATGPGWKEEYLSWQPGGDFADGTPSDSFSALAGRHGDLGRSPEEVAKAVAAAWFALGYPVTVESDDTLRPPRKVVSYPAYLTGTDESGFGALFSVGEGFAVFSADSPPYPGKPYGEEE